MKKKIIIICWVFSILLTLLMVFLITNNSSSKINIHNPYYLILYNSQVFSNGGVGVAGEMPDEAWALKQILKNPNAKDYFLLLCAKASNAGKLYALCGLYITDRNYYNLTLNNFGTDQIVTVSAGCSQFDISMENMIDDDFKRNNAPEILYVNIMNNNFDKHVKNPKIKISSNS